MLIRNMIGKEMYQFFKSSPFEEVDAIIFLDIWAFMANKRDRSPNFEEPVLKDMVNIARISLRRSYWRNPQL